MSETPSRPTSGQSAEAARSGDLPDEQMQKLLLQRRMRQIGRKLLVLSGKGGVGKSTVAANLAVSLARSGQKVGLLDVDIHGPSIPQLLGLTGRSVGLQEGQIIPIDSGGGLSVMSIGFLLASEKDPVIWRGPRKFGLIRQFLTDVEWGRLDCLVVDSPPGTGDEPLTVAQLVGSPVGAVIVTTPQDLAIADVRRCISFCQAVSVPVVGIIENMSGYVCPGCGRQVDLFKAGAGRKLAAETHVPFLGRVPIDPAIVSAGDAGTPFVALDAPAQGPATAAFADIVQRILDGEPSAEAGEIQPQEMSLMRIALPMAGGRLSLHFGHCEEFALLDVDTESGKVVGQTAHQPPAHEPGALPRWLKEMGADVIIAGGMGQRAQQLFAESGIEVVVGAAAGTPEELVSAYLGGALEVGDNLCDH